MRRALRWLGLVTLALAAGAGATGWAGRDATAALPAAHAILAHAATLAGCLAASVAFVLGLQGLLEGSGRRVGGFALFVTGPALMAASLVAEISGLVVTRDDGAGDTVGKMALLPRHGWEGAAFVVTAALMLAAALLFARPDRPQPED